MAVQQATSRRGVTHLVDTAVWREGRDCKVILSLCGRWINDRRLQPATWPWEFPGPACPLCARGMAKVCTEAAEIAQRFAWAAGGKP